MVCCVALFCWFGRFLSCPFLLLFVFVPFFFVLDVFFVFVMYHMADGARGAGLERGHLLLMPPSVAAAFAPDNCIDRSRVRGAAAGCKSSGLEIS